MKNKKTLELDISGHGKGIKPENMVFDLKNPNNTRELLSNSYKSAPTHDSSVPTAPEYDTTSWDDTEEGSAAKEEYEAAGDAVSGYGDFEFSNSDWLDETISDTKNFDDFSYDVNSDALYQQYVDQYLRQGKTAAKDAMGQAASLTGGYGNSYADTVGTQTYLNYVREANSMIPEFYNMALDKYNTNKQTLLDKYSFLVDEYAREYGEHSDGYKKLLDAYNIASDAYYKGADMYYTGQGNKNSALSQGFDDAMDVWGANEDLNNKAFSDMAELIKNTGKYDAEEIAAVGMTPEQAEMYVGIYKKNNVGMTREEAVSMIANGEELSPDILKALNISDDTVAYTIKKAAREDIEDKIAADKNFASTLTADDLASAGWTQEDIDYLMAIYYPEEEETSNVTVETIEDMLSRGHLPSDDLFKKAGIDPEIVETYKKDYYATEVANAIMRGEEPKPEDIAAAGMTQEEVDYYISIYQGNVETQDEIPENIISHYDDDGKRLPGYTTDNPNYFDEHGVFLKAIFMRETADGIVWKIGDKEYTVEKGKNPYTGTTNPDANPTKDANGNEITHTFSNGYQPDNVASYYGGDYEKGKLSKSGIKDYVNGVEQNVWQTPDGKLWIWDGTQNEYQEYTEDNTSKSKAQKQQERYMPKLLQ